MGLFKIIGIAAGLPLRPTTTRERSRRYQREANDLLEQQLYAIQDQAKPRNVTQVRQVPNDSRPRRACPACLEMMLVGASTCPHCRTTGITSTETTSEPVTTNRHDEVFTCLECSVGTLYFDEYEPNWYRCDSCEKGYHRIYFPELFQGDTSTPVATNPQAKIVDCPSGCGGRLEIEKENPDSCICLLCENSYTKEYFPALFQ